VSHERKINNDGTLDVVGTIKQQAEDAKTTIKFLDTMCHPFSFEDIEKINTFALASAVKGGLEHLSLCLDNVLDLIQGWEKWEAQEQTEAPEPNQGEPDGQGHDG
jgi:hypothetical protein